MKPSSRQLASEIAEQTRRNQLRLRIQRLIAKWEPILGVHVQSWNLRTMKTYWASTNERDRAITFNSQLGEMSPAFLNLTVVHELVHLRTDGHDRQFYALMDRHVPNWRRLDAKYSGPMTRHS